MSDAVTYQIINECFFPSASIAGGDTRRIVASRNPGVPASSNHMAGRDVDSHHGLRLDNGGGPLLFRTGATILLPARIRYSVRADRRFGSTFPSSSGSAPDGKSMYSPPSTSRVVLPRVISEFGVTWSDAQAIASNM